MNVLPFPFERIHLTPPPGPLPVAWDGEPVSWDEWIWQASGIIHLTPPNCPKCSTSTWSHWWASGRTLQQHHKLREPAWIIRLQATRCATCGHDQVYDLDTHETWDLDETDYGPCGSYADDDKPTLF